MATMKKLTILAAVLALSASAAQSAEDPAAARVEAFDTQLTAVMKDGPTLGVKGRYRRLDPVVQDTFDLPLMTRFAVGPAWASMSDADHQALVRAFGRLTVANYAHNFDRYDGERFEVSPTVQTRGPDKIVQSRLVPKDHAPVNLVYRMRQSDGAWKIVDVYYDGVSQLTTRRSDFAGPAAAGGAKALLTHLELASSKLMQ
ncbi:MAG: ABC transporter substrate-binding protein [Caulobacteraceae bacterium]|jgi:phospholipid transport system substrate-binding protein